MSVVVSVTDLTVHAGWMLGLALVVWRSWSGDSQMKAPKIAKLGKK